MFRERDSSGGDILMPYQDLIYEMNYWGSLFHPYIKAVFCLSCCYMIKIDLSIESSTLHLPQTGELFHSTYYITKKSYRPPNLWPVMYIFVHYVHTACRFHIHIHIHIQSTEKHKVWPDGLVTIDCNILLWVWNMTASYIDRMWCHGD